jgi:hypothetical protein
MMVAQPARLRPSTDEDGGREAKHSDNDREREQDYERVHGNTGTR